MVVIYIRERSEKRKLKSAKIKRNNWKIYAILISRYMPRNLVVSKYNYLKSNRPVTSL